MAHTNFTIQILAETNPQFPVRAEGEQTHALYGKYMQRSRHGIDCRHVTVRQRRQVQADRATGSQLGLLNDSKELSMPHQKGFSYVSQYQPIFSKSKSNPLMN